MQKNVPSAVVYLCKKRVKNRIAEFFQYCLTDRSAPKQQKSSFYSTWGYITLVLGSGQVDNADLLSKVVKNFFSNREKTTDRRKYKGKHKNSPMVIKFL